MRVKKFGTNVEFDKNFKKSNYNGGRFKISFIFGQSAYYDSF